MKDLLRHNWHLKLISLVLAAALWATVARTPTSEIGVSVSLEYQNIPSEMDVLGTPDRVDIRVRGASSLVRTLAPRDVSLPLNMSGMTTEQEKVLPLTPSLVRAPVGIEVVRINPEAVKLTISRRQRP
jgi:hypothetical protein